MSEAPEPTPSANTGVDADDARRALDDRYGRTRSRGIDRRFGWIAGGIAVIAGMTILLVGGWQQTATVEFQDIGRTIVDEHRVDVRFEVTGPAHTPVACAVEAQNPTKAIVGWKIVELPVTEERSHSVSTTVTTTNRATTGSVKSCWVLEDPE
ncbi:hypothetical protein GCM10009847_12820 [Leucobacter tardus]|uniref:DUF4307 domain-containing protein n=1 Tax=Leucobacter tardus TaxID=501483 RepID=A0A939TU83_9MICO|nr:DUF4307 domain-containing protein [Leucobacter tardus]MBO2989475.1 DUF4307 domain-containing protein [Leucobacter tardus]